MLSKKKTFEDMLSEIDIVRIYADKTHDKVVLPAHVTMNTVILEYGLNLPKPIHDLKIDDEGVSATLSFGGTPYFTHIPWDAVYAITCVEFKRGVVWERDIPRRFVPKEEKPALRLVR